MSKLDDYSFPSASPASRTSYWKWWVGASVVLLL